MSMTIEELVYSFAIRQFHKAPINTERDLMCVCSDFANEFFAQPLASRLTAEEKDRVRKEYWRAYSESFSPTSCLDRQYARGRYQVLREIFGSDFFKEGE